MSNLEHNVDVTAPIGAALVDAGPEVAEGGGAGTVRARGYWEQVWRRFKRDRVAIAGGVFVILLILTAIFGGPIDATILGHGPNDLNGNAVHSRLLPVGPLTRVPSPTGEGTSLYVL